LRPPLELADDGATRQTGGAPTWTSFLLDGDATFALGTGAVVAGLLVLPFLLRLGPDRRAANVLSLVAGAAVLAIAALGVSLLTGYTGMLSLGHGGLMAIGAAVTTVAAKRAGWSPWLALGVSVVAATVAGAVLGIAGAKGRAFAFAALSVVFLPAAVGVAAVAEGLVARGRGGARGRLVGEASTAFGYPAGNRVGDRASYYLIAVVALAVCLVAVGAIVRSPVGRALQAIRDSEIGARAAGVPVGRYRVYVVSLSAAFAGLSGGLLAQDPRLGSSSGVGALADPTISLLLVTANVLGGLGTFAGPLVGVALLSLAPDLVIGPTRAQDLAPVLVGAGALVGVVVAPGGVTGTLHALAVRRRRRRERVAPVIRARMLARGEPAQAIRRWEGRVAAVDPGPAVAMLPARGPSAGVVLEVAGLRKSFGGVVALEGVDLAVSSGEVHALVGPNGSGKTTLLNCIAGADRADAGSVVLAGHDITALAAHRRAGLRVARTFQVPQVWRRLSVIDNVRLGRHALMDRRLAGALVRSPRFRQSEADVTERARAALAVVGLSGRDDDRAGSLAHVDLRRLELARALCGEPRLLLLDEPAAGMTPYEAEALADLLAAVPEAGVAVLLVEHRMALVARLAGAVTTLERGRVTDGPGLRPQRALTARLPRSQGS